MKKKSQSSMEFLVFVSFAVIILMMYLGVSSNFLNITLKNKDNVLARDLALQVKNEINLAGLSENNYQKEYILPSKINNKDYELSIPSGERELTVTLEGNDFTEPLATKVDESVQTINPGSTILIKKEDDLVYINIICNQDNIDSEICGTSTQCLNDYIPNNLGCILKCQQDEYGIQWRIIGFCDGVYCSQGSCDGQFEYPECDSPYNCRELAYPIEFPISGSSDLGCENDNWGIVSICDEIEGPEICCSPYGQIPP